MRGDDTHTDESGHRCPHSLPTARVEDAEYLACLVSYPKSCDDRGKLREGAFPFENLNLRSRDTDRHPHNRCGESEGLSLERTDLSRRESIAARSAEVAKNIGENQQAYGAAITTAGDLRSVRLSKTVVSTRPGNLEITTDMQVAFVLADGSAGKERHSVLRFHPATDKVVHAIIREKVMAAFIPFERWT